MWKRWISACYRTCNLGCMFCKANRYADTNIHADIQHFTARFVFLCVAVRYACIVAGMLFMVQLNFIRRTWSRVVDILEGLLYALSVCKYCNLNMACTHCTVSLTTRMIFVFIKGDGKSLWLGHPVVSTTLCCIWVKANDCPVFWLVYSLWFYGTNSSRGEVK